MFGLDDHDDQNSTTNTDNAQVTKPAEPVADGHLGDGDSATTVAPSSNDSPQDSPTPSVDQPSDDVALGSPVVATSSDNPLPDPTPAPAPEPEPEPAASNDSAPVDLPAVHHDQGGGGDLLQIKQEALQKLSPLLGQLDQTAEEKFRTLMMMIQASDNQNLVKDAYDAAQQITDEKVKAQALLDVVNEINYFTQKSED